MGKILGPEIEYCWDIAWTFSFNNEEELDPKQVVTQNQDGSCGIEFIRNVQYNHNLIIFVELQDAQKRKVDVKECTVKLASTSEMLDFMGKHDLVYSDETKRKIQEVVYGLKQEFAGYEKQD